VEEKRRVSEKSGRGVKRGGGREKEGERKVMVGTRTTKHDAANCMLTDAIAPHLLE
jgi:hypothetical protein